MNTIYLRFDNQAQAIEQLGLAGWAVSEWQDHLTQQDGQGWGTLFEIPGVPGHHANLFDCGECPQSLQHFVIDAPAHPYNERFGHEI